MEIKAAIEKCLKAPSVLDVASRINRTSEEILYLLGKADIGRLCHPDTTQQSLACINAKRRHVVSDDIGFLDATYQLQQYEVTLCFGGTTCFGIQKVKIHDLTDNVVLSVKEIITIFPSVSAWRPQNLILWLALALVHETHRPEINPKTLNTYELA